MNHTPEFLPEFAARVEQLKTSWQVAKAAAAEMGIEKEQGKTWDDMAEQIAHAEFTRAGKDTYVLPAELKPEPPGKTDEMVRPSDPMATPAQEPPMPKTTGRYATEYMRRVGFLVCDTCGAQHQTGEMGQPICPEARKNCPRLK